MVGLTNANSSAYNNVIDIPRPVVSVVVADNKVRFNDPNTPKKLTIDLEMIEFFMIEMFRVIRSSIFDILDSLQMRAIIRGKQDVVEMIEADKVTLRNLPDTIDCSTCATAEEILKMVPQCLAIDYNEKYGPMLK
jgi:hypothetical protein